MDGKLVSAAIRAQVWPALKERSFERFAARSAWRDHEDRVDVVNFQAFASTPADLVRATPYSFAINVGCYFKYIPEHAGPVKQQDGMQIPGPPDCPARARLRRGYFEFMSLDRTIWSLDKEGKKIPKAISDARDVLIDAGLSWFARFDSPRKVFEILSIPKDEDMEKLWGFGRPGSPIRCYFLGYAARAAGLPDEARANLLKAANTPSFALAASRLISDAESA